MQDRSLRDAGKCDLNDAKIARLTIADNESRDRDVLRCRKLQDMRESAIESASVVCGGQDFLKRRLGKVDRKPPAIQVADSVVKRDEAIDTRLVSFPFKGHEGERVGVDCDGVAEDIRSATFNGLGP